mmetsp:Transcript_18543/g.38647  ORF Transcript_18543/g.38647 Transcript_18543/m.38647 type:complete len:122 (+) Transcript_18543:287-652(+)
MQFNAMQFNPMIWLGLAMRNDGSASVASKQAILSYPTWKGGRLKAIARKSPVAFHGHARACCTACCFYIHPTDSTEIFVRILVHVSIGSATRVVVTQQSVHQLAIALHCTALWNRIRSILR